MIKHVLPRMACGCAIFVVALAHCGCQSMKGSSGWASAWRTQPKPQNPNDREVVSYWGQKKQKPKQPDKEELKSLMAQGTEESRQTSFDNHLRQGNRALKENRLDEARSEYEKGLALRPNDPDCHHRLAVVADKEGQFGAADDHYEAALKQRPRDPNLLSDMGYSYMLRGDESRAETTLNQALAISPSHKGAMGNLGMIYARQGRYEDALAMFRRGGTEAEAQQYLAQLFPQRRPSTGNLASNGPGAQPAGETPDLRNLKPDDLKDLMDREKYAARERRQQQFETDNPRPRNDWMNEDPRQQASAQQPQLPPQNQQLPPQYGGGPSNQPLVIGPGSNPPANQLPIVTPDGGIPMNPGANPSGFAQNFAAPPAANPAQQQFPSNGFPSNPAGASFRAPAGSSPNIDVWNGAGVRTVDQVGNQENPFQRRSDVVNVPYQSPSPGAQQFPLLPNLQPSPGAAPANPRPADSSASLAAAQVGMNVGPGGLFPVAPADPNPSSFGGPNMDSRFGHEFPAPPQYQNPGGQFAPNQNPFGVDPRQGAAAPPSRAAFGSFSEGAPLAPQSPTSNWSQAGGPVAQAGMNSPLNPAAASPLDRFPASPNSGWAEKPNLNGGLQNSSVQYGAGSANAAPFNGSWPPPAQQASPAFPQASSTFPAAASAPSSVPSSVPMWNGGQNETRPQPGQFGSAPAGNANYYPEQWPGSQPR